MKYWDNEGKHTKLFEEIWDKHVPAQGESESPIGEAVRCFGRVNYDMGNNGCGNIYEKVHTNSGYFDDEEDEEYELEFYGDMWEDVFGTLAKWVGYSLVEDLKEECQMVFETSNFDRVEVIDKVGDALGDKILKEIETVKSLEV